MTNYSFAIQWKCLFFAMVLTSCLYKNDMQELGKIWTQLISSRDAAQEREFASELHKSFGALKGNYTIYATLRDGTKVDFVLRSQDIEEPEKNIESVQVDFYWSDEHFIGAEWKPKDINNIYLLLLE